MSDYASYIVDYYAPIGGEQSSQVNWADRNATVTGVSAEIERQPGHSGIALAGPKLIWTCDQRLIMWPAAPSTTSFNASDSVGCACTTRATSSAVRSHC